MDSILAGTYATSPDISLKLSQVTVLLQPGMMQRIRQFKPTEADLKNAFYKLVRSSQTYFKPSSKYFLPIVLNNGLTVASLRYEEKTAEQVLGVKYLPLISSSDHQLIKLLFIMLTVFLLAPSHCISISLQQQQD